MPSVELSILTSLDSGECVDHCGILTQSFKSFLKIFSMRGVAILLSRKPCEYESRKLSYNDDQLLSNVHSETLHDPWLACGVNSTEDQGRKLAFGELSEKR